MMEYPSSSTYSQNMLHSISYSSIPPLLIPKNYQTECSISVLNYYHRNGNTRKEHEELHKINNFAKSEALREFQALILIAWYIAIQSGKS